MGHAVNISVTPAKGGYFTQEQLYAICVLMLWGPGISATSNAMDENTTITLRGVQGGNAGLSIYLLKNNPNVTDIVYETHGDFAYNKIFFKVLGVPLCVTFDEDGCGNVAFA